LVNRPENQIREETEALGRALYVEGKSQKNGPQRYKERGVPFPGTPLRRRKDDFEQKGVRIRGGGGDLGQSLPFTKRPTRLLLRGEKSAEKGPGVGRPSPVDGQKRKASLLLKKRKHHLFKRGVCLKKREGFLIQGGKKKHLSIKETSRGVAAVGERSNTSSRKGSAYSTKGERGPF